LDIIPDLETSYNYSKNHLKTRETICWGSSSSASLCFYMIAKHPKDYKALTTNSPSEYFKIENKSICDYQKKLKFQSIFHQPETKNLIGDQFITP